MALCVVPDRPRLGLRATALAASIVAAAITAAGCSSAPKPTQVSATILASPKLNPSVNQRPSPVLLRVYELKSATVFSSADFMTLFHQDQSELASESLAREEIMVQPGESKSFDKTLAPETRFIGVIAAFRNLEKSNWRSLVAVQPGRKQRLVIKADELAVAASVEP